MRKSKDKEEDKKDTQIVVNVNSKNKDVTGIAADVSSFVESSGSKHVKQAWPATRKRHHRRRRPGRVYAFASSSSSFSDPSLQHRRISAASGGSVVVRETLAMVNTVDNWLACLTQGNVDFALPAQSRSVLGMCLISPQRQVMSLIGFHPYVEQGKTDHVNDVFKQRFAPLIMSLVDRCFAQQTASAIRLVVRRQPYNVVAYPLTVRATVEGVLLVYREDQVTPAEFSSLIVTAS